MNRFFWLCVPLFLSPVVQAATINVPADQPTIQAAINVANAGDVVLVAPGTYTENINFMGKAITVKSSGGTKVTTIDGGHLNSVVTFNHSETLKSLLHGFTIQNGAGNLDGGGIFITSASPTITGNLVKNNTACNEGAGIAVEFSSALVEGNTVSNNSQSGCSGGVGGAGIAVGGAGSAQIVSNVIQNNTWGSGDGGGLTLFAAGTPTLKNNIIRGNIATGVRPSSAGGGIWIVNGSDALIVQNLIYNNSAGQGSGIYFLVPSGNRGPLLVNNTIVGTSSAVQGSAVYAGGFYDQVHLYNNLMIGANGTSALYCDNTYDQTPPTLTNNDGYSAGGTGIAGACSAQSGVNGNVSVDPLFVSKSNFRLQAGSPVIDAGDNSAPNLPTKDLAGAARIVDGDNDGDGAIIDMGAYEYPN
jgi:parallel beta-helix repeat protein